MTKIDVISGFLGAGKTTIIKKLFESKIKDEKVVLIENEFGEIGIDSSFLKDAGIEIKEINAGCICCSLVGDFSSSMKEVLTRFNPDRIIIEPSGVGKLSDIVDAIKRLDAEVELNILCTVVDTKKAKLQLKNFGEFFIDQVKACNSVIMNKVEIVDEDKKEETYQIIRDVNKDGVVISTSLNELTGDALLEMLENAVTLDAVKEMLEKEVKDAHEGGECDDPNCSCHHHHHHHHHDEEECDEECECHHHHHHDDDDDEEEEHHHHHDHEEDEECCCHHHHHDEEECDDEECECHHHHHEECEEHHHHHHHHHGHDADEVFISWGKETTRSISKEQLEKFLEALKNDESLGLILRSKGVLKASDADAWYYFDFVSGDYEIRLGSPEPIGKVVVIGSKLDEHRIEELFEGK